MREKEPSTDLYLCRHGETDFPLDRIYCDEREDPPLNENGRRQAEALAQGLAGEGLAAVYASPVARTRQTAEAVAAAAGCEVILVPELVERRFGVWEGLTFDQIRAGDPDGFRAWKADQAGYAPAGGETAHQLAERVCPAIEAILARHPGERIAVVSHVGPLRVYLAQTLGLPLERYRWITLDYASATRLDVDRGQRNLRYLNRVFYGRGGIGLNF